MRFHIGFSFRLKQLIKWLIPILIALGLFSFSDLVKADTRIDIVNTEEVDTITYCGRPLTDYVNYFESYVGDTYNFVLIKRPLQNTTRYSFLFIPNYYDTNYLYTFYNQYENGYFLRFGNQNDFPGNNSVDFYYQSFIYTFDDDSQSCSLTSFLDSVSAQNEFLSYVEDYSINKYEQSYHQVSGSNAYFNTIYNNGYCTNNFCYAENTIDEIILYSNVYTIYKDEPATWWTHWNSQNYEHYDTYYNNELLSNNEKIDYGYIAPVDFPVYGKPIRDLYLLTYTSSLSNNVITYRFKPNDSSYGQHNYPMIVRSYYLNTLSNSVYNFLPINCSLGSYSYTTDSTGYVTLTINGLSCSNIPSGAYQISFDIAIISDDNNNYNVDNFTYSVSGGYNDIFYDEDNKVVGYIFLSWGGLANNYKMFVSSSNSSSTQTISINSTNDWTYEIPYNLNPFEETNPTYNEYYKYQGGMMYGNYGLSINRGLLLTNNYTMSSNTTKLKLFFPENTYIYVDYTGNSNQVCYYYNGNITCNNVSISFTDFQSDDYDLDYYFSEISNYIDTLSSDMARFGQVVQSVYDSMPSSISVFFFVVFILGNVYILLKLIRR